MRTVEKNQQQADVSAAGVAGFERTSSTDMWENTKLSIGFRSAWCCFTFAPGKVSDIVHIKQSMDRDDD